jgi:hypothetical protein
MKKRIALFVPALFLLAACASEAPSQFPIASGPLKTGEVHVDTFGSVGLASRVFDVVNQDQASESNTGLSGRVQPMPVDIVSAYAASKFRANGGPYTVRFVIKSASINTHPASGGKSDGGFFSFGEPAKVEMTVDLNVMVVATGADGTGASINATSTQSDQVPALGSPEENRAAYLKLTEKAVQALDAEITRQLGTYFGPVVTH